MRGCSLGPKGAPVFGELRFDSRPCVETDHLGRLNDQSQQVGRVGHQLTTRACHLLFADGNASVRFRACAGYAAVYARLYRINR